MPTVPRRGAPKKATPKPAARKPVPAKSTVRKPAAPAKKVAAPRATTTRPAAAVNPQGIATLAKQVRLEFPDTRVTILRVPWEAKGIATHFGAKWHRDLRCFIYPGPVLPVALQAYASEAYSWDRWLEDQVNGTIQAVPAPIKPMQPRKHQQVAIDAIRTAATRGMRGYIEADAVGLGKTLSTLLGAVEVAKLRGFSRTKPAKLLILCPKSVIPHWRNTIRAAGVQGLRVAILNYDQALKLITQPDAALNAKTAHTKNTRTINQGTPNVKWDLVILDECHRLKNDSNRARSVDVITRAAAAADQAPFVIYASATIGQSPLELRYLASLAAQLTGRKSLTGKTWGAYLAERGYHVTKTKTGYSWISAKPNTGEAEQERVAAIQQADTTKLATVLFGPNAPSIRRAPEDIVGWPSIQRIPYPVELDPPRQELYESLWVAFREELRLHPHGTNPRAGIVAQLRFRQKASLLLLDETFDQVQDLVENGYQVAISAQFIESVDLLHERLRAVGIATEEFSGRQDAREREAARVRFQHGQAPVIVFTVTEGISLHAGEQLADGSRATLTPRATVVHDVRYSSIECAQIEGRAHRDGQAANVYYMYAEATVQAPILDLMFKRMANMRTLSGEAPADEQAALEALLRG